MLSRCFFLCVAVFVIGLGQISSFFSLCYWTKRVVSLWRWYTMRLCHFSMYLTYLLSFSSWLSPFTEWKKEHRVYTSNPLCERHVKCINWDALEIQQLYPSPVWPYTPLYNTLSKIEVQRDVQNSKSGNMTSSRKYREPSKECMWHQRVHFYMVFNVYDSTVTRGKGGAHVALYWICFDSEVILSVKLKILK